LDVAELIRPGPVDFGGAGGGSLRIDIVSVPSAGVITTLCGMRQSSRRCTDDQCMPSGASDVSIPSDVFRTLVRTGTITKEDTIGSETYTLADGSRKKATTFRIRSLKVGPKGLEDVKGSVAEDDSPLLLGMSFLSRFRSWSVDNERHVLVLK
jgi:hypothetical protein